MKAKTKYYIYRVSVDSIIIIMFIWLGYKGYLHYGLLIKAIILMSLLVLYKWIAIKIGLNFDYNNDKILEIKMDKPVGVVVYFDMEKEKNNINKRKLIKIIKKMINSRIVKKYPIILDIFFWGIRLLPWNWMHYFFCKIGNIIYNIIVLISSNKDIYYKKRNINMVQSDWSFYEYETYHYLKWVFVYPILRLLLVFKKFRKRILKYESIIELIRVRFIACLYSMLYLYMGYYDFVKEISWGYKLIFILIITGIVWPLVIVFTTKTEEKYKENLEFYLPTLESFCYMRDTSMSMYLLSVLLEQVKIERNSYLQIKYNFVNYEAISRKDEVSSFFLINKFIVYGAQIYSFAEVWNREKTYGVSFFCYGTVLLSRINLQFIRYMYIYEEGIKELGEEYMKKYELSLKKLKDLYKCRQLLLMDMRRLLRFEKYRWMISQKNEFKAKVDTSEWEKEIYKAVPEKYMNLEFYNLIWKYTMYVVYIFIEDFVELDLMFGVNKNYVIIDIMKKVKDKKVIDLYNNDDVTEVYKFFYNFSDYIPTDLKYYKCNFYEELCKEIEQEYFKEEERLKEFRSLISEKYILEYIDKYCLGKT